MKRAGASSARACGAHRLTAARTTASRTPSAHVTSPGLASDQSYWYDAFGNLTQKERDTNHIDIGEVVTCAEIYRDILLTAFAPA